MRRFLGLLMLVPFAVILVLSCDKNPTAPENAQAATAVQESSTPQADKPPTLPLGISLGSWTLVQETVVIPEYDSGAVFVACPSGTAPVTGGFENVGTFELYANRPAMQNGEAGWYVFLDNQGEGVVQELTAYAACVAANIVE